MSDNGWFADTDGTEGKEALWRPNVQLDGICLSVPIWFKSEIQCLEWIYGEIIGCQLTLDAQLKLSEHWPESYEPGRSTVVTNRYHLTDYHAWHKPKQFCNTCVPCLSQAIEGWYQAFWTSAFNQTETEESK